MSSRLGRMGSIVVLAGVSGLLGLAPAAQGAPPAPAPASPTTAPGGSSTADHVPGELVVGFTNSASAVQVTRALDNAEVAYERSLSDDDTQLVKLEPGQTLDDAMDVLRRQPGVRYVEPNYIWKASALPDDDRMTDLWGLDNTGQTVNGVTGTPDADIDAPEAWDLTTGSTSVVVAVVDSGIAFDHPDLAGNIWSNPGETGGGRESNGIDDDGNGYVDDWRGWDARDEDNDPRDFNAHGTHVAGTIGARGNNGSAVTGVAQRVSIMPVRVFGGDNLGTTADAAQAFNYAGDMGARIVNFSGGGSSFSQAVADAVNSHPNTLFVVAAGNAGADLDAPGNEALPCELPSPNLICVAASTSTDTLADFSNRSEVSVDIAAPGTDILSTVPAVETVFEETFETDPLGAKWTAGANAGSNTWARTSSYTPGTGSYSVTDSPPLAAPYAANSDTWIQTTNAIDLGGRAGCRALFPFWVDTEPLYDTFYVSARADSAFGEADKRQIWWGTGGVNDIVDVSSFGGGNLYLRFGVTSDVTVNRDGVYIDDIRVDCLSPAFSAGGASELSYFRGTSMATPHVSGVAALVLARNPTTTTAGLRAALLNTGDPRPAFTAAAGVTASGSRLNAFNAVSSVSPPPVDVTPPTVTIGTPAEGAQYEQGSTVFAQYACSDSQSAVATCTGTRVNGAAIDTSTLGWKAFTVTATDFAGNQSQATHSYLLVPPATVEAFGSLSPQRILDTRQTHRLDAGATIDLPVTGRNGVPATGVGSVVLNLTATAPRSTGYLTTWPHGEPRPNASSLNFAAGDTVANLVIAKVGANGAISIWNSNDAPTMSDLDVIVDIVGWFPATDSFGSLSPQRILDTRQTHRLDAGATIDLPVTGRNGVPATGVGSVVLNLTATAPRSTGYLTTWPHGEPRPNASSLNFAAGDTVANLVIAKVGANGAISIWNSNDAPTMSDLDVIVDIVGWFPA
jgi:subtilisin family serine protease